MIKSIVPIDTIQGDNMYFKRLRDLREDHDMKQSEVAEYLGIQQTVYSRYERGFQSIPVEHLIKLADLYKVSTDYMAFDASTVSQCILPIVMIIVNKVYFDRRKDIFVN